MARHDRIRQMVDDEGRTFEEVSRLSEEELGAHISRQRARQIYDNVPRKPGRPWPR